MLNSVLGGWLAQRREEEKEQVLLFGRGAKQRSGLSRPIWFAGCLIALAIVSQTSDLFSAGKSVRRFVDCNVR